jgi:hypothetical protein
MGTGFKAGVTEGAFFPLPTDPRGLPARRQRSDGTNLYAEAAGTTERNGFGVVAVNAVVITAL